MRILLFLYVTLERLLLLRRPLQLEPQMIHCIVVRYPPPVVRCVRFRTRRSMQNN